MRNDVRIRRLIQRYGLEGYGLYNLILESITEALTTQSPIPELQETCEDIADFYNANTARVDEIVRFMIANGLLEVNEINKRITCTKLYKYLEASQTRSEEIRSMIRSYHEKAPLCLIPSETVTDIYEEKNRREENRKEHIIVELPLDVTPKLPIAETTREVIEYLNNESGSKFNLEADGHRKLIGSLLKKGYSVKDMKKVIKIKCLTWLHDEKMRTYLRPSTLFRPSHVDDYIGEYDTEYERAKE